ncbi:MAG: hypothetical protein ACYC4L_04775 [Chloroflexota bacterium]
MMRWTNDMPLDEAQLRRLRDEWNGPIVSPASGPVIVDLGHRRRPLAERILLSRPALVAIGAAMWLCWTIERALNQHRGAVITAAIICAGLGYYAWHFAAAFTEGRYPLH